MARTKAFDQQKAQAQAMQVFWQKGFAATSVEDLVDALGLSRSSLYDTFGDKRNLFLTVLRQYSDQVIGRMRAVMQRSPTPVAAVKMIMADLLASANTAQGAKGCFMVNSVAELAPFDPEVTQIAAEYATAVQSLLAQGFADARSGRSDGEPVPGPTPEQLATYVFNTMQGMRLLIKTGTPREQLQPIVDLTLQSLA
jgi:TetR/AcrR family transcriptional repressor of nem operon